MALKKLDIDIEAIREQFIGLNDRHPGLWPILPKSLLLSGIFVLIVVFAWLFYWKGLVEELDAGRAREVQLKEQYRDKMRQAVNLEVLRKQKEQVAQYVSQLERQLLVHGVVYEGQHVAVHVHRAGAGQEEERGGGHAAFSGGGHRQGETTDERLARGGHAHFLLHHALRVGLEGLLSGGWARGGLVDGLTACLLAAVSGVSVRRIGLVLSGVAHEANGAGLLLEHEDLASVVKEHLHG